MELSLTQCQRVWTMDHPHVMPKDGGLSDVREGEMHF
jgi:hypothetical protein